MSKIKTIKNNTIFIKSKRFYEISFVVVILLGFILWIIGIFHGGKDSSQFQVFFRNCRDFFADMLNVVGYSSQKDVYNNTMYTGLGEKAYPPLTYIITYFFSRLVDMQPYYEKNNFFNCRSVNSAAVCIYTKSKSSHLSA
ncbi:MAG: hypothetical protein NC452_13695 [Eubacterium sp.]|nr:hypothetical protein [Eubacterium sp.]